MFFLLPFSSFSLKYASFYCSSCSLSFPSFFPSSFCISSFFYFFLICTIKKGITILYFPHTFFSQSYIHPKCIYCKYVSFQPLYEIKTIPSTITKLMKVHDIVCTEQIGAELTRYVTVLKILFLIDRNCTASM